MQTAPLEILVEIAKCLCGSQPENAKGFCTFARLCKRANAAIKSKPTISWAKHFVKFKDAMYVLPSGKIATSKGGKYVRYGGFTPDHYAWENVWDIENNVFCVLNVFTNGALKLD